MNESKFVKAYNDLMAHTYEVMDDGLHSLADGLTKAKTKSHELGLLTQEELQKISDYLQRDVEAAAHTLKDPKTENLSDWLKFDVALLENFALDAFMSVADKTSLELAKLKRHGEESIYYSGEVTSPGSFTCTTCSKQLMFKSTSLIPACPECQSLRFVRTSEPK